MPVNNLFYKNITTAFILFPTALFNSISPNFIRYFSLMVTQCIFHSNPKKSLKLNTSRLVYRTLKRKKYKVRKYFNFFVYSLIRKKLKKIYKSIVYNKFFCFWPIMKKRNYKPSLLRHLIEKTQNKIFVNIRRMKRLARSQKPKTPLLPFRGGPRRLKKKKKSQLFNFHRRLIRVFWKSQEHFKSNYLKKKRFTTIKLKNKFRYWYKKNKNIQLNTKLRLLDLTPTCFLFLSNTCVYNALESGILHREKSISKADSLYMFKNEILSLPQNYVKYVYNYIVGKFRIIKKVKRSSYIYIKNRSTQWKNTKKKPLK